MRVGLLFVALLIVAVSLRVSGASLKLPTTISSHMVLQRAPATARIWGWATAGDVVTVTVADEDTDATVEADGTWLATLQPMAAGGPYNVTITDGTSTLTLTDVMFGDVFVCSGQSNMEFTVTQAFNGSAEIADSINYPGLRVFAVAEKYDSTPQTDCKSRSSSFQWGVSSPTTIGGAAFNYFSAVCYFYGRDLYVKFGGKVPIGLIATSYGGTCIEAWSSADIVNQCTTASSSQCYNAGTSGLTQYSGLYNAMMHPLINHAITGVIWYQGENNWQDLPSFECRMPLFVQDLRDKFGVPDLPFIYVDCTPGFGADLRAAQASAMTKPNVYRVVTIDIADPASPYVWYHPRNKQTVGTRMTLVGLYGVYHENVTYLGPQPVSMTATASGASTTFELVFDSAQLKFNDTAECVECCKKAKDVFLVADAAGTTWSNATSYAITSPGHITVTADVANASGVALEWTTYPNCYLLDSRTTLPTTPFQRFVSAAAERRAARATRQRQLDRLKHSRAQRKHHHRLPLTPRYS